MTQHPLADALREAFAYAYEYNWRGRDWITEVSQIAPDHESPNIRNIRPLYELTSSPTPASKSEWTDETTKALAQYEKSDTDRDQLRDALAAAYSQGAADVHKVWSSESDPDFGEAASDYASHAIAALASKTAVDPVTVEWVTDVIATAKARWTMGNKEGPDFNNLKAQHASMSSVKYVAQAVARALGKDQ